MQHPPTVYDVAARAGVSIATVSRVLRQPDVVRPETRRRVLATIDALGYVPSASARGLAGRRTGVLGLLVPSHDESQTTWAERLPADGHVALVRDAERPERRTGHNLYFDDVLLGAEGAAWSAGYAFMVAVGAAGRPLDLLDLAGRLDGLIVAAHPHESDLIARLRHRLPIALIAEGEVSRADRVTASNREGMFALVQHLAETHRVRTLVFVSGPPDSPDAAERRAGLLAASAAGGVVAREVEGDFTRATGREVARQLAAAGVGADAVVCANDETAVGVLRVFASAGIAVPGDVIVTGFDGISDAAEHGLTTVQQPMRGLGATAIQLLVDRIGGVHKRPRVVRLAVEVRLRSSCGCVEPG